ATPDRTLQGILRAACRDAGPQPTRGGHRWPVRSGFWHRPSIASRYSTTNFRGSARSLGIGYEPRRRNPRTPWRAPGKGTASSSPTADTCTSGHCGSTGKIIAVNTLQIGPEVTRKGALGRRNLRYHQLRYAP